MRDLSKQQICLGKESPQLNKCPVFFEGGGAMTGYCVWGMNKGAYPFKNVFFVIIFISEDVHMIPGFDEAL